jgi:TolB protein
VKRLVLPIFFCLSLSTSAAGQKRKIAFERGDNVWVADLDGTAARKIAKGSWPNISPDGMRLAFNTNENQNLQVRRSPPAAIRHIAVADLVTGKVTIFKSIRSDNSFGPVSSPDGKKLAFHIWDEERWRLGIVDADGSGFYFVKDTTIRTDPLYALGKFSEPAWAPDGRSIFCHDMFNIYRIDLEGNILKQWALSELQDDGRLSSDSRLSVSPDGRVLLVSLTLKHSGRGAWMHQSAVFTFDFETTTMTRVSGEADSASDAYWLTNDEFLCVIQKENENKSSLYRVSIDGQERKLPVKHARWPTVSGP